MIDVNHLATRLSVCDPSQPHAATVTLLQRWASDDPQDARITLIERFELPRARIPRDTDLPPQFRLSVLDWHLTNIGIP